MSVPPQDQAGNGKRGGAARCEREFGVRHLIDRGAAHLLDRLDEVRHADDIGFVEVAPVGVHRDAAIRLAAGRRSEEHTSELQSLMRISYAVFCLKKKTNKRTT